MPTRPPSLRTLWAFEATARHENISKAAAELNLTRGAVSQAIQSLEARLGQPLFDRRGRGVVLTEAGRILAGRVRPGVDILNEALAAPAIGGETLTVSVLPTYARFVLVPRLGAFRERHPDIALTIKATSNMARLNEGEADLAIRYGPGGWAGVSAVRLRTETLFPVTAPAMAARFRAPEDLYGVDLIACPHVPWGRWLEAAGLDPGQVRVALSLDESALVLDAAAEELGVALARSALVAPVLASGRLVRLFDIEVAADHAYWIVWDPASRKEPLIARFRAWAAVALAD